MAMIHWNWQQQASVLLMFILRQRTHNTAMTMTWRTGTIIIRWSVTMKNWWPVMMIILWAASDSDKLMNSDNDLINTTTAMTSWWTMTMIWWTATRTLIWWRVKMIWRQHERNVRTLKSPRCGQWADRTALHCCSGTQSLVHVVEWVQLKAERQGVYTQWAI